MPKSSLPLKKIAENRKKLFISLKQKSAPLICLQRVESPYCGAAWPSEVRVVSKILPLPE
jgi:hypothetical protein